MCVSSGNMRKMTLYMCFNGTVIWGGETMCVKGGDTGL